MYLEQINQVNDIKKLDKNEWNALAQEIREFLIEKISVTGGHLASNLGAVELTEVEADTGYDREAVPCDYTVYSSVQCAESGRFYWLTYRNTCPRFVELPRLLEHNRVLQFPLETAPEFRDVTEYAE